MIQPDRVIFSLEEVIAELRVGEQPIPGDDLRLFLTLGIDLALDIRTSAALLADRYAGDEIRELTKHISREFVKILCRHTRYVYDEDSQELRTDWTWVDDRTVLLTFCIVDLSPED